MRATRFFATAILASALFSLGPPSAMAQSSDAPAVEEPVPQIAEEPAPYDDKLARLSEILGAVHYLRNLCNQDGEPEWRQAMQALIDEETASEPKRRARMVAAYNRGFRSFASVYTRCTASAVAAEGLYRNEGATLAVEIAARYGN